MSGVVVLSGGVGAARFLRGLVDAVEPGQVTAVVNTGDDIVLHGLAISPDLDTIVYTLAGAIDPERGWGLAGESWRAMGALGRYEAVRPANSDAGARWFNLGDLDLGTHLYRTARLAEGASPTEVADEVRRAWGVPIRMLPMTDGRRSTVVVTRDHGPVSFQDYFVRLRHDVPATGIEFTGPADPAPDVLAALGGAGTVVIAPSNPLVSIAPIRSLAGVDDVLAARRERVVAISPIVGGEAIKGPAARLLTELGHEASVVGVARLYAPVAVALVVDPVDADHVPEIESLGLRAVVTPSVMHSPAVARALARATLDAVR